MPSSEHGQWGGGWGFEKKYYCTDTQSAFMKEKREQKKIEILKIFITIASNSPHPNEKANGPHTHQFFKIQHELTIEKGDAREIIKWIGEREILKNQRKKEEDVGKGSILIVRRRSESEH